MNILIPIEISSRELSYKIYLSHLLALKGFKCYLGYKSIIWHLTEKMQGYIYFDKGYHKGISDKIYDSVKKNKGVIISLEEEGAVDYPDNQTLLTRYSRNLFSAADLVFLWGIHQSNYFNDRFAEDKKVVVSGHPRFQLLKEKYHLLYQDEVDALKSEYGEFILMSLNMVYGNNIMGDDYILDEYGSWFDNIQSIVDFDKKKFDTFISLAKDIANRTNKTVIIRPHPEENIESYKTLLSDYNNIRVIFKGSVIPWLIAAEIMIHPDCSTGIESFFLGKKPISYLPENYPQELVTRLPLEASFRFTNQKKLIDFLINQTYRDIEPDLKSNKFIEDGFSYSKDSGKIIVDNIIQLRDDWQSKLNNQDFDKIFLPNINSLFRTRLRFLRSSFLGRNKLKGYNHSNIKIIKNNLTKLNNEFNQVKIRELSNRLFLFQ